MSRLNDFSNQPSFTKHTVMPTSLQTFWGDRLTNLVKTIHLISAEQGWARCNKAEVKCVLTESLLSLRARTRATYQSANIYDAFIFSCNYEHLLWVPIIRALIYASEQASESSHSLHILSSGGKSGKPSRTAQHSIYFLSITAQDLTDHFKPMNRNSALPDEPRGARGPGEWDWVLSSPSKYMYVWYYLTWLLSALAGRRSRGGAGGVWRVWTVRMRRAGTTRTQTSSSTPPTSPRWAGCPISRWSPASLISPALPLVSRVWICVIRGRMAAWNIPIDVFGTWQRATGQLF